MNSVRLLTLLCLILTTCSPAKSSIGPKSSDTAAPSPSLGQKLSLALPSSTGNLATIGDGGQPLVLELWAPNCKPCKEAVPALVARQGEIRAKGARLILVAVLAKDESTDDARATLSSWGVNIPFLVDSEGAAQRAAGITDLPATIVLDDQHNIRWIAPVHATPGDVVAAIGT